MVKIPKTINEIFDHVNSCQYYYLSRIKIPFQVTNREEVGNNDKEKHFMELRKLSIIKIEGRYDQSNNKPVFDIDSELWTIKKVLRRLIWHDRIHGKAIVRILEKQRYLKLIDGYEDPFCFGLY
jgi:hypothetical protein